MSASDENQSNAKESPRDTAGAGSTIEHKPAQPPAPSPLGRKLRLYGILFAVLVVGVLAGAATYPYWRADAASVLARVGLELEDLETGLGIPRWLITHGRETPKTVVTAANAPPPTSDKSETGAKVVTVAAPPGSASIPLIISDEWREATEELSGRLSSVEDQLSGIEERLRVLESVRLDADVASVAPPSAPAPEVPGDIVQQLETIAARLVDLEAHRETVATVDAVPAQPADGGALIATIVALAGRVAAMEATGSTGTSEHAALRDDTLALAERLTGLDDKVKQVDVALRDDTLALAERLTGLDDKVKQVDVALRDDTLALAERVTGLDDRVAQVGAALEEETPGRDRAALLLLSVGQLAVATAASGPYETQLDALRAVAGDQANLADPMERLASHAATGAPTFVALRAAFAEASGAVIRSRDVGSPEGVLGQALARVASLVTIRKVDDIAAGTVDGVLAAADEALDAGDLAVAVTAVAGLDGAPGEAIANWLSLARARLAVDRALSDLQASAIRALAAAG
jgi:hypothetical protein